MPHVGPHRAKGTHEARPVLVVLARCCSALAPTPRPESTSRPALASLSPILQMYFSTVSDIIRGTLQVFHIDVAKVDWDVAYVACVSEARCKCFIDMLQVFIQMFYRL
jgi:hypothetical protein